MANTYQFHNNDAFCPSCERFIGPESECPYCGEESARDPVYSRLKYGSIALAIIGLILVYMSAMTRDVATVTVSSISPLMQNTVVMINGTVEKPPYVSKKGDYKSLSFNLNDGTGDIRVCAYGDEAVKITESDLLPQSGDKVAVTGILDIEAGRKRLIIRSSGGVKKL